MRLGNAKFKNPHLGRFRWECEGRGGSRGSRRVDVLGRESCGGRVRRVSLVRKGLVFCARLKLVSLGLSTVPSLVHYHTPFTF